MFVRGRRTRTGAELEPQPARERGPVLLCLSRRGNPPTAGGSSRFGSAMRAAGVQRFTADVEVMDLPDPPPPGPDEVLIEVHASGVANWDDLVRTGSWDLGRRAPLAMGTQCAGVIAAIG